MKQTTSRFAALLGFLLVFGSVAAQVPATPAPPTEVHPVTDTYFGTQVTDPYRWLENLNDPKVQDWMKQQASYAKGQLDAIHGRDALLARIHALGNVTTTRGSFSRFGERYFYRLTEPGAQSAKLYYRDGLNGEEHLLIDPAALGAGTSTHYSLDNFTPSWDGRYVAYGVSAGGSEASVTRVIEVASGQILAEALDRTAGSVVSWRPDNKSFFYMRYLPYGPTTPLSERMYNARAYLHTLGAHLDGEGDPVVFGKGVSTRLDVPEGQGTYVIASANSRFAIAVANHNMDPNPATLYVANLDTIAGPSTPWTRIAVVDDGVKSFQIHGDTLYFLSQKDAPRGQLMALPLRTPDLAHAKIVLAQGSAVLNNFSLAKEGIYVRSREGAQSHLVLLSYDGAKSTPVPLPVEGTVYGPTTDAREAGALFNMQGWTHPPSVFHYDPIANTTVVTNLIPASPLDTSGLESKEVFALSYDGTRVPLSLIFKKNLQLDGSHPTIVQGYGSYGATTEPYFSPRSMAWIERDGIIAIAHVRGGGEYGEAWHLGGEKQTKLNTVFDFIACAQYLVDEHYTSPDHLAGQGGSAGGITVGGGMNWRPDLFRVILDQVGMSDTLRFETEPNGPPNVSEFGSVSTEQGFHALYAFGAYEHVRQGVAYPAVLFTTGAHDPRVSPWQMMKMAARVQAATTSQRPVLLRIDYDAGHGIGSSTSQQEALTADLWSFCLWQMGDPEFTQSH